MYLFYLEKPGAKPCINVKCHLPYLDLYLSLFLNRFQLQTHSHEGDEFYVVLE